MSLVIIRAFIIYVFAVGAVRIMGKRQIGELKPHELVITILISSASTIPLQDNNMPLLNCILPVLLFVSLEIIVSVISLKSVKFRSFVQGRPIAVIRSGKINQKMLKRLCFTVNDLVDAIRMQGYFDMSEVQNAVIETNGTISVQPFDEYRPLTPHDVDISAKSKGLPVSIVIEGKSVGEYFKGNKIKSSAIELILQSENKDERKLFLLTVDDEGNVFAVDKEREN